MENPQTWDAITRKINEILLEWHNMQEDGYLSLSLPYFLKLRLEEAGYLKSDCL